jgi:hypothetical protein
MAWAVITVPSYGIPVINVTPLDPLVGGVSATVVSAYGTPVTVVTPPMPGLPVRFVAAPPL